MTQERNPNTAAEPTPKPDFAACCQRMAGEKSDCGPTMERMMSTCGPMIQRMQAACGEKSQESEPVSRGTEHTDL